MSDSRIDELLALKREAANEIVDVDEPGVKLVIFALEAHYFAFKGHFIREVLPGSEPVFFIPGMPASVQGVINVRGDIESVIFLQPLLQLSGFEGRPFAGNKEKSNKSSILLAKAAGMHTGIRVDQLVDVVDVPLSQLQVAPETLPENLQPYVAALLDFAGRPVALLDIEKVFNDYQAGLG